MEKQSRRSVLVTVGVGATVGLAGCMSGGGSDSEQNTGDESENTENTDETVSDSNDNETSDTVESELNDSTSNESESEIDENTEDTTTNSDVEFRQLFDNEVEWSFDSDSQTGTATFVEGEVPPAGELHLEYGTINEPEKDIIEPPVNNGDTIEFNWSDKDEGYGIQMIWRYDGEQSPFAYSTIPDPDA